MKNLIMFFVLVMVMAFSNYEISYSQETGNFYFLIGTEGNERAIMYLHIEGDEAYGSYYTKNQSINFDEYNGFDGRNLKLSYWDNGKERTITGTLSGDIVFVGKHNSKNVNLSLANTPVNSARITGNKDDYFSDKKFTFNVRTLNNLDYYGILEDIVYLDENIIIFHARGTGGRGGGDGYFAYSIHTGKRIESSDIVSNSFIGSLELGQEEARGWGEIWFYIMPNGKIVFYYDPGTIDTDDGMGGWTYWTPGDDYKEFTFEEIKPFIKRGSPLDYLFN